MSFKWSRVQQRLELLPYTDTVWFRFQFTVLTLSALLHCPVQRTISVVAKRVRQLNEQVVNLRHPSKTLLRQTVNKLRIVERQQTV